MTKNPADLDEVLDRLGTTTTDVATSLRSAGVTGKRGKPECCPIANYLTGLGFTNVSVTLVDLDHIEVGTGDEDGLVLECVEVSSAIEQFVANFDAGKYPELDERAAVDTRA